jgi:hypothetical protein
VHIIAIRDLDPRSAERSATLAAAVGSVPVELAARLRAAGRGPVVLATTASPDDARSLAAAVEAAGLRALVLEPGELETEAGRFLVRTPAFEGTALHVVSRQAASLALECAAIRLVLRGTMVESTPETATTRERKFSLGKAIMTQGLVVTKTVEKTTRSEAETREGFAHLYAPGHPPIVLRESALSWEHSGLPRQPSRAANFTAFLAEVRRRAPGAVYDDRLLTRAGQVRMLGPALPPEEYLDVAVTLLVKALGPGGAHGA